MRDDSHAYEYADPPTLAVAEEESSGPPVPAVERKAQMSMAMKQMGTRMDLVMKR